MSTIRIKNKEMILTIKHKKNKRGLWWDKCPLQYTATAMVRREA